MQPRALDAVEALGAGMTDADMLTDLQAAHGSALYDFARHQGLNDEQAADSVQGLVAIRISVVQGGVGSFYEILSSEQISIAGHPTTRWELRAGGEIAGVPAGTLIYEYIVQLGLTPETNLVAHTDSANQPDYEQNKLVLDEIMVTLTTP